MQYAKKTGITHAQCWAHARRKIFDARDIEPAQADQAMDAIPLSTRSNSRFATMGKKNWLFSWTELGAKHVRIVQSLLATCRLHNINPYDYFVDVLQRVGQHAASLVDQLTPRVWKEMFADNLLRSDLHNIGCLRARAAT